MKAYGVMKENVNILKRGARLRFMFQLSFPWYTSGKSLLRLIAAVDTVRNETRAGHSATCHFIDFDIHCFDFQELSVAVSIPISY
jgi:hypothetical protein